MSHRARKTVALLAALAPIALAAFAAAQDKPAEPAAEQSAAPDSAPAAAAEASDPATPAAAAPEAAGLQALISTVDDEQIGTRITRLSDGVLELATEPPRSLPLDAVARIDLGKAAAAAPLGDLSWVGQDNHDLVQVGSASGGNGIQDVHIHASNLRPVALKQIVVTCRFPEQWQAWRLDTSRTPHWRLAMARVENATEAELYIEPSRFDSFGHPFEITYSYDDGKVVKATVTATTHTSDKRRVDRALRPGSVTPEGKGEDSAPSAAPAQVLLDSGRLRGELAAMSAESLTLALGSEMSLEVPLLHVKGIWLGNAAAPAVLAEFQKHLAAPGGEDLVFVLAPDESITPLAASVQGLTDDRLKVRYQGADRQIDRKRALGIVFAAHPPLPPLNGPTQTFELASGDSLAGRWTGIDGDKLTLETPWKSQAALPAERVNQIRFRGGRVTSLADLEPIAVEQVPYFGRVISWGRDTGFEGAPPRLREKQPVRSVSMHSKCQLTYALDGEYETFKATLGFDDSAGARGRVDCRVLVDGREQFAAADFRSTDEPRPIEVPLAGAKQMTLEVDFGQDEDVGDRVLWAEPRLFRAAEQPLGQVGSANEADAK